MSVYKTPLMESQDIDSLEYRLSQTDQNTASGRRHASQTAVVYNPLGGAMFPVLGDPPKIDITDMNSPTAELFNESEKIAADNERKTRKTVFNESYSKNVSLTADVIGSWYPAEYDGGKPGPLEFRDRVFHEDGRDEHGVWGRDLIIDGYNDQLTNEGPTFDMDFDIKGVANLPQEVKEHFDYLNDENRNNFMSYDNQTEKCWFVTLTVPGSEAGSRTDIFQREINPAEISYSFDINGTIKYIKTCGQVHDDDEWARNGRPYRTVELWANWYGGPTNPYNKNTVDISLSNNVLTVKNYNVVDVVLNLILFVV